MGQPWAFLSGKQIPLEDAKVGIMTHALHYGTAVFEGIRGNWNNESEKMFIFRLREHYERLIRGCKILKIKSARLRETYNVYLEYICPSSSSQNTISH